MSKTELPLRDVVAAAIRRVYLGNGPWDWTDCADAAIEAVRNAEQPEDAARRSVILTVDVFAAGCEEAVEKSLEEEGDLLGSVTVDASWLDSVGAALRKASAALRAPKQALQDTQN